VAEILDPAYLKESSGSRDKDAEREPAAVAVAAAGDLVSSLSAAAYIFGPILKKSVCCEQL